MSIDNIYENIYDTENKAQKEYMKAKYPKRKFPYDVCLNCGFKLHSPAKNCPKCGKLMYSYKGGEGLEYRKKN